MPNDDSNSVNMSALGQLGQVTYSFFTDQAQISASATTPANLVQSCSQSSDPVAPANAETKFIHPAQRTRLEAESEASQVDQAARYQQEFAQKYRQLAAQSSPPPRPVLPQQVSFAGVVEREAKNGFSSHFNFLASLERIFHQLDSNGDRRLSQDELRLVFADGRFTGDDELLVILLLRNLDEIRKMGNSQCHARGVSYDDIVSYPNWQQYLPAQAMTRRSKFLPQAKTTGTMNPTAMHWHRNTNRSF